MNNGTNGNGSAVVQDETLIFLHIPKTAGTTLNRIIDRQYSPFRIYTTHGGRVEWSIERLKNFSEARRRRYQVIRGHMSFGAHSYLTQPSTYITMLREPVDRVMSAYYYIFRRPKHPLYGQVVQQKYSLQQYLEITPHRANFQCKLLAGIDQDSECPVDCLDTAKQNLLKYFRVVGLSERFDESLALMKIAFAWDIPFYSNYNVTTSKPKRKQLDPATVELVQKYNQLDVEIYDFGKKLFGEMVEKNRDAIQKEIEGFTRSPQQNRLLRFCRANVTTGRYYVSKLSSMV
jgi:hypothetical protein